MRNAVSPIVSTKVGTDPQGKAIDKRVWDLGGSESRAVMVRIGVETLLHVKAGRLPGGLSSRESLRTT